MLEVVYAPRWDMINESAQQTYPFAFKNALTNNGSEFKDHFGKLLTELSVPHRHTYPKTPKMNAHCERFKRTIEDDFVDYNEDLLFCDLAVFNKAYY